MRIPLIAGGGGMRERRFLTVVSGDEAEAWAAECGFQSLSFVLESVSRKVTPLQRSQSAVAREQLASQNSPSEVEFQEEGRGLTA